MHPTLPPLTALLDLLPDAVCVVDTEGVLLYANAALERMLGYTPAERLGQRMLDLVHPDDLAATRAQVARLMEGIGERHFRNRYVHREGHTVDLLWSAQWLPEYGVRVAVARDVSELRRVEQELEHRANHDALTGVVNRRRLRELLEHALVDAALTGVPLALLYADVDGFKAINDTYGHDVGDRVLVDVAQRLQAGLRKGDVVGRMGGDEFVALLPRCDGEAARSLVDAMHRQLQHPFALDDGTLMLRVSVGTAAYPADAQQADTLLARADAAMYSTKRARAAHEEAP
jgi:diguanylate cyclase (GGDEF)-like protein/PAS domain S-box-containing protein